MDFDDNGAGISNHLNKFFAADFGLTQPLFPPTYESALTEDAKREMRKVSISHRFDWIGVRWNSP